MLTTRSRKAKLDRVDDEALKARLAAAEATVREIDALPPAKVRGREKDVLGRYERALEIVDVGRAELASRQHESVIANAPARREYRDQEDERTKKREARQPVVSALRFAVARAHPELTGATLAADRLSETEAEELVALVKRVRRLVFEEDAEPLSDPEIARYETLMGAAAGDPELFARKRREQEAREKVRALGAQRRLASLPRRRQLTEAGSTELPRFVFTWLKDAKDGNWTVAHVGVLATLMLSFENRDASLIAGARFEEMEGEPVLVIPGGVGAQIGFSRSVGGNSFDATEAGFVRLRPALRDLVRNEWFVAEVTAAETRVRLGPRARQARGHADP